MMHKWITAMFLLITLCAYGQNKNSTIADKLCGVWIEENFLNVFDSTRNICDARRAFARGDFSRFKDENILGVEVCKKDTLDGRIYGHFRLSHFMMNVVCVDENEDIPYCFNIDMRVDGNIDSLELNVNSYSYWGLDTTTFHVLKIINDTAINIHRYIIKPTDTKEASLNYIRITTDVNTNLDVVNLFCTSYLKGNYFLKDSSGNVISDDFKIDLNGEMLGYKLFDHLKVKFESDDPIMYWDNYTFLLMQNTDDTSGFGFLSIYNKKENSYYLYDALYSEDSMTPKKGNLRYVLVKR